MTAPSLPETRLGEEPHGLGPSDGYLALLPELTGVRLFVLMSILDRFDLGGHLERDAPKRKKALAAWASGNPKEWLPYFDAEDGVYELVKRMATDILPPLKS